MSKVILKECLHHGLTEFSWTPSNKRYRCQKCYSEYVQKRRYKIKEKSVEYKGGKCEICGYDKCIDALEFHHKNPKEKDFGIGYKGYTRKWDIVKEELDKCILVCANCHREIHSQEHKELKDRIMNRKNLSLSSNSEKYIINIDKIIDMKDNQGKSFYQISNELKLNRNTIMKYYKKYKK